jgi:hypothetical protein
VAGLVLAVFAPVVAGLRTLSYRDTDRLYLPVRTLVVEELRAGRLPLWNPYEATGRPLFAEGIHSVLHPISLLGAALAPASVDFLILGYLLAAAVGTFVLARTLGASRPASAAGALAFVLSGFTASMTGNLVFLAGIANLPWLLAAARAAGAGARLATVGTAAATACAFLAGDAQAAIVGVTLGALLAADAGGWRGVARAAAGMCVGVLLAGVQIAPTAALLPLTTRQGGIPEPLRKVWALAPWRVLEWAIPGLARGPLRVAPRTASGVLLDPLFADSVYLGAPLLVAAALAAARGRRRTTLLLAGAALALLWLALGHHLGARQLFEGVPVWSRFRYSEKLLAPLGLCVCALGALGIDRFAGERLGRASRWLAAAAVSSGALAVVLAAAPSSTAALASRLGGDAGPFYRSTLAAGLPHLALALGALVAADRLRDEGRRRLALALLVALAPAVAVQQGAHLGTLEARQLPGVLSFAAEPPGPRLLHPDDRFVRSGDPRGIVDAATWIDRLLLGPPVNVQLRIDTIEPYGAFDPGRLTGLVGALGPGWAPPLRRFGVTHVIAQLHPLSIENNARAAAGGRLVQHDPGLAFQVWEVPHRPWAFFARRAVAVRAGEALPAFLDLVERGDDETVLVEAPDAPPVARGRVLRVERGTGRLRVEAESDAPALLVVQDAFWPGWRAAIDGQPAEILAADHVVRAVRWPAGRHSLEMRYEPPELRLGLGLSALGALLLTLLVAAGLRRRPPLPAP